MLVTEFIHTERLQSRLPAGLNGLRYPKIVSVTLSDYCYQSVLERLGTTESTTLSFKRRQNTNHIIALESPEGDFAG